MFIARDNELKQLTDSISSGGKAALVYGKRRVGKTSLIKEALKAQEKKVIYYECLRGTIKENIEEFTKILKAEKILTFNTAFESFQDIFAFLNTLPAEFAVVFDEYPYLSTFTDTKIIDSVFQSIIDNHLNNISLVLSGSQISIMKDFMSESNALYGRFSTVIHLRELSYKDAALFYPSKSVYEKLAFYSVFGGSPFVLRELNENETLEENIVRTILSENNPVQMYASNILLTDYMNTSNAERILSVLGNGKKKYSELESKLFSNSTGNLAKQLKTLSTIEIIRQVSPINKKNDAKKRYYEINDNLIRFYYTYVHRNRSTLQMIGPQGFYNDVVSYTLERDFIPRRFEDICRSFFSDRAKKGLLPGITDIGTYYYDDPVQHKNGEFDVALRFGDDYELYEAKFYKKPVTPDEIHREARQVREIKDLEIKRLGFIAASGFEKTDDDHIYYTGEDLLTP